MTKEEEAKLEAAKKWFKEAQYGMMVHWGLYALLGKGRWSFNIFERSFRR